MFHVILFRPEIPPNTGNAIRLCANTGAHLHLAGPLGFDIDDALLRRAGLDYHVFATRRVHASLDAALATIAAEAGGPGAATDAVPAGHESSPRVFALSTRGRARFDTVRYRAGDVLLFGSETTGLPDAVLDALPEAQRLRLPMRPGNRSLNLSNAVAVTVYEAWRQLGYAGAEPERS
jgi:tRNA (cytidine/uridine-2'-O-)-methyltransferase